MAAATYYEILGVGAAATAEEIRRAYRVKAKSLHPDVSAEPDAQARFAALAMAYETLANRAKRTDYDASLRIGRTPGDKARSDSPHHRRAHYTWTNIATEASGKPDRIAEFDDLYETFFGTHKRAEARSRKPK